MEEIEIDDESRARDAPPHTKAFRTHKNYVRAFAYLAGRRNAASDEGGAVAAMHASLPQVQQRNTNADLGKIRSCLHNAWSTELLMCMTTGIDAGDEFVRLTNNWAAVQAYYAGFHSVRALGLARGMPKSATHSSTQRQYVDLWVSRPPAALSPWTLGFDNTGSCMNLPEGVEIDTAISAWSRCDATSSWSLAAKAMKTTREDAIKMAQDERRRKKANLRKKQWKDEESARIASGRRPRKEKNFPAKARLTLDEAAEAADSVRAYSVFDYLYRLRVRSNYEDSTMFLDGPEDKSSSKQVHADLRWLASMMVGSNEAQIGRLVGQRVLRDWMDNWLNANLPGSISIGLPVRRSQF